MATGTWITEAELVDEVGDRNIIGLADTEKTGDADMIERKKQRAIDAADGLVNRILTSGGYALPLVAIDDEHPLPTTVIRLCAAKIAHWQLYNTRGKRDTDKEGSHVQEKYDWAINMLNQLMDEGIPAELDEDPVDSTAKSSVTFKRMSRRGYTGTGDEYAR